MSRLSKKFARVFEEGLGFCDFASQCHDIACDQLPSLAIVMDVATPSIECRDFVFSKSRPWPQPIGIVDVAQKFF